MKLFVSVELTHIQRDLLVSGVPAGTELSFATDLSDEEAKIAFSEAEVVFGNPPVAYFSQAPLSLKYWQLDSAGFDQYKGVHVPALVANIGDYYAVACAETMVAGILAFYRGISTLVRLQDKQEWQGKLLRPTLDLLRNKSVLVLGAGAIAKAIKKILLGFGSTVKLSALQNPEADLFAFEAILLQLPTTDIVINTLPGHLYHYVSEPFFNAMQSDSLYASVGRGATTDEEALLSALNSNKIKGAVLDVTQQEPLPTTSPLWTMQNVLLTQHTGGGQINETEGKIKRFLQNLQTFLSSGKVPDQINLSRGY